MYSCSDIKYAWTSLWSKAGSDQSRSLYLHGAYHGAQSEHGGRIPQSGLAVERALCVHQQDSDLCDEAQRRTLRPDAALSTTPSSGFKIREGGKHPESRPVVTINGNLKKYLSDLIMNGSDLSLQTSPFFHLVCPPERPRSRSGSRWSPSQSRPSRRTPSEARLSLRASPLEPERGEDKTLEFKPKHQLLCGH